MLKTVNVITEFVREVLDKPCFGFVAAINESGHPQMSRFFGFNYDPELTTFTSYTFIKDFQKMRDHILSGEKISIVVSSPVDFKTIQLKGTLNRIYETPENEMNIPRSCNKTQSEIMERWGIPKEVFANWNFEQSVAVVMNVDEIFDQTPKVDTGKKIS